MRNPGLDEVQAGFKIAGRSTNNLRYADGTTLMADREDKLKSFLMNVKQSEKTDLKINIQKTKIMASGPITLWQIDGKTMETVTGFVLGDSKITANRVLPRKCTGHSKHPLPTTQEKSLHTDITRWSTPKSD